MQHKFIIAIDGTVASGKGTLARNLGDKLSIRYLCTGNLYRAVAKKILSLGEIAPADLEHIASNLARTITLVDTEDPNLAVEQVGILASKIAQFTDVRIALDKLQKDFAEHYGQLIVEGRDIGSVVFPDANVKFYLTAGPEQRAQRRCAEYQNKNIAVDEKQVLLDLLERDQSDTTRDLAPLTISHDAVVIDTSNLTAEQVLLQALSVIKESDFVNNKS